MTASENEKIDGTKTASNHHRDRWRIRYAAFGAAVAVAIGGGGLAITRAADSSPSSFVAIAPCRIVDTRAATVVGPRNTPLIGGTPYTFQVRGTNGNCTIPASATAVNMNVTSVNPTTAGFLTVWPADEAQPLASSLNWVAGQAATPNSVNASLGSTGQVSLFASGGTVDVVADITGYFVPAGASGTGTTSTFRGDIGTISPSAGYQFLGPQAVVTTTAGQRMTATAAVPIGTNAGPANVRLDICYVANGAGGALIGFNGDDYTVVAVPVANSVVAQPAVGSVVPGAGTWRVGACARTAVTLDDTNFVNGWVQVTN